MSEIEQIKKGEIITFYSYKGGTGRTMALANVAILLARQTSGRVLAMDWDLEAPGLEDYFRPYLPKTENQEGILDWVEDAVKKLPKMEYGQLDENLEGKLNAFFERIESLMIPVNITANQAQLFLIRAGNRENDYSERMSRFSWSKFYQKNPSFFPLFAQFLAKRFDYVLIDSRTGHTDVGGVCTVSMPDKLVLVFNPNEQSLNGVIQLAQKVAEYRMNYDGTRPLGVYPLPSRVDFSGVAQSKREFWQNSYRSRWERAFQAIYGLPATISLKNYFEKVYIRHDSNYAFGEDLAVLSTSNGNESIQQDYKQLVTHLAFNEIWEDQPFANMSKPFELFFVFSKNDDAASVRLLKELSKMRRDNIISWDDKILVPVEDWNGNNESQISRGGADVFLVLNSPNLEDSADKMRYVLDAQDSAKVFKIDLQEVGKDSKLEGLESLTHKKALSKWEDPDDAWVEVIKQLRRHLAKLNESKLESAKQYIL